MIKKSVIISIGFIINTSMALAAQELNQGLPSIQPMNDNLPYESMSDYIEKPAVVYSVTTTTLQKVQAIPTTTLKRPAVTASSTSTTTSTSLTTSTSTTTTVKQIVTTTTTTLPKSSKSNKKGSEKTVLLPIPPMVVPTVTPAAIVTTTTIQKIQSLPTGKAKNDKKGMFTSPLLSAVMMGQSEASNLPYWYGYRWNRKIHPMVDEWTEFLYKEIDKNADHLINGKPPEDIQVFCPQYASLDRDERVVFWLKLASVLMSFESEYHPTKTYDDTKNVPGAKGPVISTGMMMMSHASVMPTPYQCTMINSNPEEGQKDLLDPKKNMACGIRIMNRWIKEDNVIAGVEKGDDGKPKWIGMPRYWGPFRHPMLRNDPEGLHTVMKKRAQRWQQENQQRDDYMLKIVNESLAVSPTLDKKIWEGVWGKIMHPSLITEKYKNEESHRYTAIVRLMNQTAICYK